MVRCPKCNFGRSWKLSDRRNKCRSCGMKYTPQKSMIVPNRKYRTILPLIEAKTKPGSLYFTDDYQAYGKLALRGSHVVVKKEKGVPKGRDHINGIEGFWSYAKHWLHTYRGVHKKFFPIYLGEISYRYNHRNADLVPEITRILRQSKRENRA